MLDTIVELPRQESPKSPANLWRVPVTLQTASEFLRRIAGVIYKSLSSIEGKTGVTC